MERRGLESSPGIRSDQIAKRLSSTFSCCHAPCSVCGNWHGGHSIVALLSKSLTGQYSHLSWSRAAPSATQISSFAGSTVRRRWSGGLRIAPATCIWSLRYTPPCPPPGSIFRRRVKRRYRCRRKSPQGRHSACFKAGGFAIQFTGTSGLSMAR